MEWQYVIIGAIVGVALGFLQRPLLPFVLHLHRRYPQLHQPQIASFRTTAPRLYRALGFDGANEAQQLERLMVRIYRFSPLVLGVLGGVAGAFIGADFE